MRMPVVFVGHGSPMNALETNDFTESLRRLGGRLPRPKAILCVSAHWMTEGSWVTAMPKPKTIHDFYGFPKELSQIQYPAPGDPGLAQELIAQIRDPKLNGDTEAWGLDHGSWAVLRHIYPKAEIPVLQLSLHLEQPAEYHLKAGRALAPLRDRGILILGSGNIVHNLRKIRWEADAKPFDWAVEFDEWTKGRILARDSKALSANYLDTEAGRLSVPTSEHYYPLLYCLGASSSEDEIAFEYEGIQNASISMRAVSWGL